MGPAMRRLAVLSTAAAVALSGCSASVSDLTTGSLFGGSGSKQAAAAPQGPVAPASTPMNRAFQVGTVTARALRCGYNFDPIKLKTTFLASEQTMGLQPQDVANVEKAYNVAFNGVNKAASADPSYCSEKRTADIKQDLGRLLAGDFTPQPMRKAAEEEEEGLVSGIFGGGSSGEDNGPLNSKTATANGF